MIEASLLMIPSRSATEFAEQQVAFITERFAPGGWAESSKRELVEHIAAALHDGGWAKILKNAKGAAIGT